MYLGTLLSGFSFEFGDNAVLFVLLIIVGVLLGLAGIFAFVTRIVVWTTYVKYNRIQNSEGLTAREAAEKFADVVGLKELPVEKCSWWRALLSTGGAMGFGNNYSIYKKTIFLRRNIIDKKSITAVGVSTQKVGLALQDKEGSKLYKFTAYLKPIVFFAPVMFIPLVIVGVFLDIMLFEALGLFTMLLGSLGFLYFVLSFLIILFTIKVESRANKKALQLMKDNNFLTEEERGYIQKLYKAYMMAYIADFIIALLELVKVILKTLAKMKKVNNK